MSRLENVLKDLKEKGEKALITFITAGDPDLSTTEELIIEMANEGADIIEIGIPFSDPVAEGPIIQAASQRALINQVTLTQIFESVRRVRTKTTVPLVMMMYANSLYCYGKDKFFEECKVSGIDAVIVPDIPFEEKNEIFEEAKTYDICIIDLIAPTSSDERIRSIATQSNGFLYCISSLGVTGMRESFTTDFSNLMGKIKKYTQTPVMLGFGISNPEQVEKLKGSVDGVIIGSAIVKIVGKYGHESNQRVGEFVRGIKEALAK